MKTWVFAHAMTLIVAFKQQAMTILGDGEKTPIKRQNIAYTRQ
jgi:hypothetical protein